MKSRLHLYPHAEPRDTAYIVGERAALRALGQALIDASASAVGFESIELHTADGHAYSVTLICAVAEEEWQTMQTPYCKTVVPQLQIIQDYNSVQQEIRKKD